MRCFLLLATAVVLLSGATADAVAYTPLCGGSNPACTYAYSTERKMVAGATTGIAVYRSVDGTTRSIGFTSSGRTDTAAVQAFCNAAVSGVISRNCFLSTVYDQAYEAVHGRTGGCDITNATPSAMPTYLTWPAHSNLPQFQKGGQGPGMNFYLDKTGCTALTGGAQSLFYSGSNRYWSEAGGQAGLNENTPAPFPFGAMFSPYVGFGVKYDACVVTRYCGAFDTEGEGPQASFAPTSNGDLIQVLATAGGRGPNNAWANNAQIVTNRTVPHPLVTQGRMTWGATGDQKYNGPAINRSEAFYTTNLNSRQAAALYANEAAFQATLTLGYQGPGDLFGEYGTMPGVTKGHIGQMQYLAAAYTLRKPYAGYMGPLLNACRGQGPNSPCEDIGLSGNDIDTTTLSAFCGPVSGLDNCTVETWYNSALNQDVRVAGGNSALDFTAVSASARPTIAFSGCGTSKITVCIVTSRTRYFTGGGAIRLYTGINGYTLSAVAQRTGSLTVRQHCRYLLGRDAQWRWRPDPIDRLRRQHYPQHNLGRRHDTLDRALFGRQRQRPGHDDLGVQSHWDGHRRHFNGRGIVHLPDQRGADVRRPRQYQLRHRARRRQHRPAARQPAGRIWLLNVKYDLDPAFLVIAAGDASSHYALRFSALPSPLYRCELVLILARKNLPIHFMRSPGGI
jgi:hypothetical protein